LRRSLVLTIFIAGWYQAALAQTAEAPGFIEARGFLFPQKAPNDSTRAVSDWLWRQEGVLRPTSSLQFVAGVDLRANTHDQVEDVWRIDWEDRHLRPPRISVRRLAATINAGAFTFDLGKQFIRWARADVLNPIDRFAPRDFTNVIDTEFLPVTAARTSVQLGPETVELVFVPHFTPSRMPLLTQRWSIVPPQMARVSILDGGSRFPKKPQFGVRWRHTGGRFEAGVSYFDGYNHLPVLDVRGGQPILAMREAPISELPDDQPAALATPPPVLVGRTPFVLTRTYPRIRAYGVDFAVPMAWLTVKGEAAYFSSRDHAFSEYGLYVFEVERQIGEWLLTGGYAGDVVTAEDRPLAFDPERSLAGSFIGRAFYTAGPQRTFTLEAVGRENGKGFYLMGEFSQGFGEFWRITITQVVLAGDEDDFLGQYRRNSHLSAALRLSF
jgi:hypothetical protein